MDFVLIGWIRRVRAGIFGKMSMSEEQSIIPNPRRGCLNENLGEAWCSPFGLPWLIQPSGRRTGIQSVPRYSHLEVTDHNYPCHVAIQLNEAQI
jgi:hypothetical protein